MTEWLPIESAPKDGSSVLVWSKRGGRAIAWWSNDAIIFEGEDRPHWVAFNCDDYFYSVHLIGDREPTHWQPLPEPPNLSLCSEPKGRKS